MQTPNIPRAGHAPPLTGAKLDEYRSLIAAAQVDAETADALRTVLACVEKWWDLPESTRTDGQRWKITVLDPQGRVRETTVQEVPLTAGLVRELDDVTPWMEDLYKLSPWRRPGMNEEAWKAVADTGLFDRLKGPLRNAAHHLLWYCKEITLDREPMTTDRL